MMDGLSEITLFHGIVIFELFLLIVGVTSVVYNLDKVINEIREYRGKIPSDYAKG